MEIIAKTKSYSAQTLQEELNQKAWLCVVLGGNCPNEYLVIVSSDFTASLIRGMLDHLGIEHD